MVAIGENASPGAMVTIEVAETIAVNHEDAVGLFLQTKQALNRIVIEEVLPKAIIQIEQWQMLAEQEQEQRDEGGSG